MERKKLVMFLISLMLLSILSLSSEAGRAADDGYKDTFKEVERETHGGYGNYFTENVGQWDDDVLFFGRCAFGAITIHDEGVVYSITDGRDTKRLQLGFHHGRVSSFEVTGDLGFRTNYILGNDPTSWGIGARNYQEVVLKDVWEDVDLLYRFAPGGIKYDVILGPGSDHRDVIFEVRGHDRLSTDSSRLTMSTSSGTVLTDTELIAIDDHGDRLPVRFKVMNASYYGFDLDRPVGRAVTIDPLVYSTYLGGSYDDSAKVVMDRSGNFYLVGETASPDYPVTPGSLSGTRSGYNDICVTKLNSTGKGIVYSTYIGGSSFEFSSCAFVDENGFLYVSGGTNSVDFPTTEGALMEHNVNSYYNDIFVLKLNVSGDKLIASTYISGDWYESTKDIHVQDGAVYLCGQMESHDFPSENGPVSGVHGTAFFLMMDENLTTILDSAFWDTPGSEMAICLDVDKMGTVVIGGTSSNPFFPVTPGTFSTDPKTMMGPGIFIVKYCPGNGTILFSSMMGGYSSDIISGIEIDSNGDIYFAGSTFGYGNNHFPTTKGAFDTVINGTRDGILGKLSGNGTTLMFSTLLGGDSEDCLYSLSLDAIDRPAVAGITSSTSNLPVTEGAVQRTLKGDFDCFAVVVAPKGDRVVFSTYLGGSSDDSLSSLVAVGTNRLVVCGTTSSNDFPTVNGPLRGSNSGSYDIFLSIMEYDSVPNAPKDLMARALGGSISLSWEQPENTGNSILVNYSIYRGPGPDNLSSLMIQGNVRSYLDLSVEYGIVYYYRISAWNILGEGPKSAPASNRTLTIPDPPRNLTAAAGVNFIELTWECSAFTGGIPLTGYRLYRSGPGGRMSSIAKLGPMAKGYIDEEIEDGSRYTYNLSASNEIGPSILNATVSVSALTVPTPPRDLELEGGEGTISLHWQPPFDDNGSPLIRYKIYRSNEDEGLFIHSIVPPNILEFADLYLENGHNYSYQVTAENIKGESLPSNTGMTFPRTVPTAPTRLLWDLEGDLVRLVWGPPEDNGGIDVLGYLIRSGSGIDRLVNVSQQSSLDALTYLDPIPFNGSSRFYSVSCFSVVGPSRASAVVMVPAMTMPSCPLELRAVPGDSSVKLTWDVPSTDGGTSLLGYRVHRSIGGGAPSIVYNVTVEGQLGLLDEGLTNGVTFKYWVDAINIIGPSGLSEPVTTVPFGLPDPPSDLNLKEMDSAILVSWDRPTDDGGSVITGYKVMRGTEGGNFVTVCVCPSEMEELNDTGLLNGQVYLYVVSTITGFGVSVLSEVLNASPCSTPGKVNDLQVVLENGSVVLKWETPLSTGGRSVLGYEISRRTGWNGSDFVLDFHSTNTTYIDIGLTPGSTYEYSIAAWNTVGRGEKEVLIITLPLDDREESQTKDLSTFLWIGGLMVLIAIMTLLLVLRRGSKGKGLIDVDRWDIEDHEE